MKLNRIDLSNSQLLPIIEDHWDVITLSEKTCFVCDKALGNKAHVLIGKRDGVKIYRHSSCDCHSEKWKKKFGNLSSLTESMKITTPTKHQ